MYKLKNLLKGMVILATFCITLNILQVKSYATGSVSVSKGSISITEGESATFTVTATNSAGRVDISSSNSSVATVSTSKVFIDSMGAASSTITVKGVSQGTATITVKITAATYDEEEINSSRTINVTVKAKKTSTASSSSGTTTKNTTKSETTTKTTTSSNSSTSKNTTTSSSNSTAKSTTTSKNNSTASIDSKKINDADSNTENGNEEKNDDATLKSISITGYNIQFNPNTTEYTIEIPNEENNVEINANTNSSKAKVNISGNTNLNVGENIAKLVVTAESGSTKEYVIKINRRDEIPVVSIEKLDKVIQNTNKDTIILITDGQEISEENLNKMKQSNKSFIFRFIKDNIIQYDWSIDVENLNKLNTVLPEITISNINLTQEYNYSEMYDLCFKMEANIKSNLKIYVGNIFKNDDKVNIYSSDKSTENINMENDISNIANLTVDDGYIQFDLQNTNNLMITRSTLSSNSESELINNTKNNWLNSGLIVVIIIAVIEFIVILILIKKSRNNN